MKLLLFLIAALSSQAFASGYREWRDPVSDILWFSAFNISMNHADAKMACEGLNSRLPSKKQIESAVKNGLATEMIDFTGRGRSYWTTSSVFEGMPWDLLFIAYLLVKSRGDEPAFWAYDAFSFEDGDQYLGSNVRTGSQSYDVLCIRR
ncbi:MAG: hypothetical protein ABIR96_12420 [Bdellovibrionota bacterium]